MRQRFASGIRKATHHAPRNLLAAHAQRCRRRIARKVQPQLCRFAWNVNVTIIYRLPRCAKISKMRYLLALAAAAALAQTPDVRLKHLLDDSILVDTHVDTPWYILDEGYDLAESHSYYQADIPRLRSGHVGAVFFGIAVESNFAPHLWIQRAFELIDSVHQQAAQHPRDLEVAYTAADIRRIHAAGKVAALIGLEGGHMIQDSLPILRDYYRLGVRYMTLTHFKTNDWADSGTDVAAHNGLSPL